MTDYTRVCEWVGVTVFIYVSLLSFCIFMSNLAVVANVFVRELYFSLLAIKSHSKYGCICLYTFSLLMYFACHLNPELYFLPLIATRFCRISSEDLVKSLSL